MSEGMKPTKEEEEEWEHFKNVLLAFKSYKRDSDARVQRSYSNLRRIPLSHQKMLNSQGFSDGLQKIESCVELNYGVLMDIIADATYMFEGNGINQGREVDLSLGDKKILPMNVEKVQVTLKQFVRDWSSEGKSERERCYQPILDRIKELSVDKDPENVKVLVPGAGLGRLAYDIAKMGYESQGNEFSLFMLFASNYVLNKCKFKECCTIYPWIHQFTNNFSFDNVTMPVKFPDVDPGDLPEESQLSMVAGEFVEVYGNPEHVNSWDFVVTCFFLDCAHNVLDFIELIYKILKPGGHWINLGPLLYHYADIPKEASIEPSYDIVKKLIENSGFSFIHEVTDHKAAYCQNPRSMLQYHYNCVFFTVVKE